MSILCIVPCSSRKIWDKYPYMSGVRARDAYIGPLTRMAIRYAERFHRGSWVILSAKYGFLSPDDVVPGPYNVTFKLKNTNPIGIEELIRQAQEKGLYGYDVIVVLGGKDYVEVVKRVFKSRRVINPLEGLSYGKKIKRLKEALLSGRPLVGEEEGLNSCQNEPEV
mgnify:CR=1 FL=1